MLEQANLFVFLSSCKSKPFFWKGYPLVNFCKNLNFSKTIIFDTFQDILNLPVVPQPENEFFERQKKA